MPRYGVNWPDGSYTGPITDHYNRAARYARDHGGTAYQEGTSEDPEHHEHHTKGVGHEDREQPAA